MIDTYLLTALERQRITPLIRLLYRLRRPWLRWHLSETGRLVRADVVMEEGIERARGRVYSAKDGMR